MTLLDGTPPQTRDASSFPTLRTERLVLRPPREQDAKAIAMLADDRRIAENTLRIPHPYTLADAESFIASARATAGETVFLITRGDEDILGACGIAKLDGERPELGYWVGLPFWGNGYATEAARAVIDHAFLDLGYEMLVAGARVSNPASRQVLEKCGFRWTGVALCRIRALQTSVPCDRFRLDRQRWASV